MAGLEEYMPPRAMWAQRKDSFSSLAGLEIAIPPGQKAPSSPGEVSLHSEYSEKALPPIPPRSPRRRSRLSYEEIVPPPRSPQRRSLLSYEEMSQDELSSPISRSSRKVFQLMGVHVDTDTASSKEQPRSQSRMSVSSSESGYSQDGLDEGYTTQLSARRPSSVEDLRALQNKGHFYLQAVTYSASAPRIEPSKSKIIPNQLKSEPLSLRHKDRVQAASPQAKSKPKNGSSKPPKPKSPQRSQTLDEMIAYERKRFQTDELARKMWKPTVGRPEPKFFKDEPRSPTNSRKENGTITFGEPYSSTTHLAPPPLVLRGREESRQSISHFSDQSDDESPGIMANARDSVMSHMRRTVKSPPPMSSAHATSFSEKHKSPARLMPPLISSKQRKRFSSHKGKHPLKSPFPFQTNAPKNKKPQWPPPGQHITKSTTPSFSKRLSGVMRRFSTGSGSGSGHGSASPISSSIITTESREANGPDTPMPTSSSSNKTYTGFMSNINITSPKFIKDFGGKDGEKMMSPKEILEKGSMRFADAIESARKKAHVKSKAEKRRDHIRANIVKIGQADVDPNGRINRWL